MRSYPLYINGNDVETGKWTHVIKASALIRDKQAAFDLKRQLDLGKDAEITDDVVARVALGDETLNLRAIAAAKAAAPIYRTMPLDERKQILLDVHRLVVDHAENLVQAMIAEGHPRSLAQWEVSGMVRGADPRIIEWYMGQLRQEFDDDGRRVQVVRKPDGVVCVNPPQNAAGSNSLLGALALLTGNTLVVKAPRSTPLSVMYVFRELVATALEKHAAPPGTLNIVAGPTPGVLRTWLASPDVDDILFFGDSRTGMKLGRDAMANDKKTILELAGNDGFVVWRDADLHAAARALIESYYGSGQICMVPKYAVVHPDVVEEFLAIFVPMVRELRPGYPEDPDTLLSPVLKVDKYYDYLAEAREAGCRVLCGGRRIDVDGVDAVDGMFIEPTVVRVEGLELAGSLSCVREETFFPLLPVVVPGAAPDGELLGRIIEFLNENRYGLRNSVWTTSHGVARRAADEIVNGGILKINDSHIGFSSYIATHGGTGLTGGPYGELNYVGLRTTHLQGICWGDGDPRPLDPQVTTPMTNGGTR